MTNKNSAETKPAQNQTTGNTRKSSSDFVVGSVTFVIFIIFMTAWMYFQS